ncbi:hypothetical protein GF415_04370 [Candidatus Micrarchaeota archaeon]|nr:hypothetical protein [Candidatus Micrarchaeota archaeon]
MPPRKIHKSAPLSNRSPTIMKAGGISGLQHLPRWEKYLKLGDAAEELGLGLAHLEWRIRAYFTALEQGNYPAAQKIGLIHFTDKEVRIAESLQVLGENARSGRLNSELQCLAENALVTGVPRELVAWELAKHRAPDMTFLEWKHHMQP